MGVEPANKKRTGTRRHGVPVLLRRNIREIAERRKRRRAPPAESTHLNKSWTGHTPYGAVRNRRAKSCSSATARSEIAQYAVPSSVQVAML